MGNKINSSVLNVVLFSSLILSSLQVSANVNEEIVRSFEVTSQSDFSLHNINGTVTINSWPQSSIKVQANISAENQESRDDVSINITQHGQMVSVSTDYKESGYRQHRQAAKVDYRVWLPTDSNLSAIELVNGSLTIKDISGKVEAQVVNGTVDATGLSGDSDISSVNGNVKVEYDKYHQNLDKIDVETVNGSIKLFLPSNTSADISADTMHGGINTAFGLTANKNSFSGHNLQGKIGDGRSQVSLNSVNGSIKVLKSE